jgi:hypothetical protein
MYHATNQVTAVNSIRLHEPAAWPRAEDITPHFCAYRVIARLVREGFLDGAVSFNYDCHTEAGLIAEGFQRSPYSVSGTRWLDHVDVITDRETHSALRPRGAYRLYKAHGCASRYRHLASRDAEAAAERIILRKDQLYNWRSDSWIRDIFRVLVRENVLLLIGLSGNDPVIAAEIQDTLRDVYTGEEVFDGTPRVITIDPSPNTTSLNAVIEYGLDRRPAGADTVTQISTAGGTTTAAMLMLLSESIALRLEPDFTQHAFTLPASLGPRISALTVSAPTMMRWSYILHPGPNRQHFMQHVNVNLYAAARDGYVPLTANPATTTHALRVRAELRSKLGKSGDETPSEALADHGFLVSSGKAYLPVGLDSTQLAGACRPGGLLDSARATLPHPHSLDCILVSNSVSTGFNMHTGSKVPVP